MNIRLFHKRLVDAATELIPSGSLVVCGVSGGADSMALLYGLLEVSRTCRGPRGKGRGRWTLHVAHLDHGLRDESSLDARFVRETAAALGLACTVEAADVAQTARSRGETVEEAGRRLRYAFLERVARTCGAQVVALAHHADDQAETVLHRIIRGTGLHGLAGIPPRRPISDGSEIELVRPLLGLRRAELRAYLDRRKLPFRDDPSNDDIQGATRNRIRHRIVPLIERTINPELTTALLRLSIQARRADEVIRSQAEEALKRLLRRQRGKKPRSQDGASSSRSEGLAWSAAEFAALPRAVQTEITMIVLRRWGVGLKAIGFERIEAVSKLASGGGRRRTIQLPGGVAVSRGGNVMRISACRNIKTSERQKADLTIAG